MKLDRLMVTPAIRFGEVGQTFSLDEKHQESLRSISCSSLQATM